MQACSLASAVRWRVKVNDALSVCLRDYRATCPDPRLHALRSADGIVSATGRETSLTRCVPGVKPDRSLDGCQGLGYTSLAH